MAASHTPRHTARGLPADRPVAVSPRLLAAALAAAAVLPACGGAPPLAATDPPPRVRRGAFRWTLPLTGELEAVHEHVVVVPREAAWRHPIRWMAEDGSRVRAGDKVFEFDNGTHLSDLQEADLRRIREEGNLARMRAQARSELAEQAMEVERRRTARDKAALDAALPEALLSKRDHQKYQLALETAALELEKAEGDLEARRVALEADEANARLAVEKAARDVESALDALDELTLLAPTDGFLFIGEHPWHGRKLLVGDTAFAGLAAATIPDLSEMRVRAVLSDVDDGLVQPGMPATCTLDMRPHLSLHGRVSDVTPIAEEAGQRSLRRSFRVTIELQDDLPEGLIPGMSVRATVLVHEQDEVLLAPRAALDLTGPRPRALVADGETTPVELGPCNAQECVVLSGLTGDQPLRATGRDVS